MIQSLGDVRRLLFDGNEDVTRLVIKPFERIVVPDLLDGLANDLLIVKPGLGGDFTENHDHARFRGSLASYFGERVLSEASVKLEHSPFQSYSTWR